MLFRSAEAAAQGLNLDLRRTRCILRLLCFHLRPGRCQLRCSQPGRPRRCCSSLSRRSPALLCRGELGVSLAPCARGDRALRRCVGHGAPPRGCCVEKTQPQTSCSGEEGGVEGPAGAAALAAAAALTAAAAVLAAAWEGEVQEMSNLQESTTLIPDVSSSIFTLIELRG